jgi:hypothetical protein
MTFGTQAATGSAVDGMIGDKLYDYVKSKNKSYGIINDSNTGHLGMAWKNGRLYSTWLSVNVASNDHYGHTPYA